MEFIFFDFFTNNCEWQKLALRLIISKQFTRYLAKWMLIIMVIEFMF